MKKNFETAIKFAFDNGERIRAGQLLRYKIQFRFSLYTADNVNGLTAVVIRHLPEFSEYSEKENWDGSATRNSAIPRIRQCWRERNCIWLHTGRKRDRTKWSLKIERFRARKSGNTRATVPYALLIYRPRPLDGLKSYKHATYVSRLISRLVSILYLLF